MPADLTDRISARNTLLDYMFCSTNVYRLLLVIPIPWSILLLVDIFPVPGMPPRLRRG